MLCYIGIGWCIIVTIVPVYKALTFWGFVWLLAGGIMYTIGAIFYGLKKPYMHAIWHVCINIASILHIIAVVFYL